ncbi:MAG: hypothetical protein HQK76_06070 [Desulfobacterales bacterium]|nr:hypothetical protein [Desulfobacterales bacterium]
MIEKTPALENSLDKIDIENIPKEVTEIDYQNFLNIVSTDLTDEQKTLITCPNNVYSRQKAVIAVHWHPEFIPMELNKTRIEKFFPNKQKELIIPTQHNEITTYDNYSGVEVDCYSNDFNQKVQILLHFENSKLIKADRLKKMLNHTFRYRSSQFFEFLDAVIKPNESIINRAAKETGTHDDLINYVRIYTKKLKKLVEDNIYNISPQMIKNKLLRNFIDCQRSLLGDLFINRAQNFLNAIKKIVKQSFSLEYFYRISEIIEEARYIGAGVVIPHPEQFWPILLSEYDVDGYEVWNPQSRRYTEFLISVLNRKNKSLGLSQKKLLVFMGDDTHMGEKIRKPDEQDVEKASREIGFQPAWDDYSICKTLIIANASRENVIDEYKERIS